jgi:hypothetical protein
VDDLHDRAAAAVLVGVDRHLAAFWERRALTLVEVWAERPATSDEADRVRAAAEGAAATAVAELRRLLAADVDQQWTTPVDVVRRSMGELTELLAGMGIAPVVRDEFEERAYPDDPYGLAPRTLADVDASLQEPALVWGAAKARLHAARHAAEPSIVAFAPERLHAARHAAEPSVVAFAPDLMDQSRLRAAGDVVLVRHASELRDHPARLVLVDVTRPGVLDVVGDVPAPVIGFYPHVDDELAAAASAAGCDEVLPRSVFFRRLPELLASGSA